MLNGLVGWVLLKAANRFDSITLRADDLLLTDPIRFHARRTRVAGSRRFVAFHVRVPGHWSVQQGHDLGDQLEQEISTTLTRPHVLTHLEPIEDLTSLADKTFRWEQG